MLAGPCLQSVSVRESLVLETIGYPGGVVGHV